MASVAQGKVALSSVCNALVRAAGRLSGQHRLWATENLEAMLSFALLTNRRGLKVDVGVTDHLNDSVTTVT